MESLNDKEYSVETDGEGDALIMVHGLGGNANVWEPQVGALRRFFTVIRPDLEGSGFTPAQGDITIASHVADVVALMDSRGISSAHLAGHSMGTIVCQHVAAAQPQRVKSLVLLGPLAEPPEPARGALRDRAATARSEDMRPVSDTLVQVATSAATKVSHSERAAFVRELLVRQSAEGYARNCEALSAAQSADLTAITCPTLLITGDEDAVAPPAAVKRLVESIGDAEMFILTECGHWTPVECPHEVTDAMLNFYFGTD